MADDRYDIRVNQTSGQIVEAEYIYNEVHGST